MPEDQNTEWKQTWRDEFLKWICGFANSEGGVLHIGRNDKGVVVGLKDVARLLEDIPNKVRDVLGILVEVKLRQEKRLPYIEITTEAQPYPVSYKGQYFVRRGSTNQELKGAALDTFLLGKQGKHWDGVPVPKVKVGDLDSRLMDDFRARAERSRRLSAELLGEDDPTLIEKLHLRDGSHLKRAAVLLFHPDAERFVPGAYVKIGFFESDDALRYQDEVRGGVLEQVSRTLDLLLSKYSKALISYDGAQRIESPPVPEAALREAVTNAIVHKEYGAGVPIQISVYEDKVMVWNPGQLPRDWTTETLWEKHASLPFNPDLATAFFRAGMIESWGQGIQRIVTACKSGGIPAPMVRIEATGLWMEFRLPRPKRSRTKPPASGKTSVETGVKTRKKTAVKTREKTREKILGLIARNPGLSVREMAQEIGISPKGAEWQIAKLKAEEVIRRVGPAKGGRWEVLK